MTAQHETTAVAAKRSAEDVTGKQRVAALICAVMAVVMIVTAIVAIGKFDTVDIVLIFVAAAVWLVAGWLLLRDGTRWPAVLIAWITALGMIVELGRYQAKMNDTGTLAPTSTTYFLPALLWLYMVALLAVAFVVGMLSKNLDD